MVNSENSQLDMFSNKISQLNFRGFGVLGFWGMVLLQVGLVSWEVVADQVVRPAEVAALPTELVHSSKRSKKRLRSFFLALLILTLSLQARSCTLTCTLGSSSCPQAGSGRASVC